MRGPVRAAAALAALLCAPLVPRAAAADDAARVVEVIDGDTLRVRSPGGGAVAVRLIGIDAPEAGHPAREPEYHSRESTERLRALCLGHEALLARDAEERDGYDRLLRYVYVDNVDVNLEMVRRGQARAMRRFPHSRLAEFLEAERSAKAEGLGIWADGGMAELRWLRENGARPVEVWPAAGGSYIVGYRGAAKPGVRRGEVGGSVEEILRLHGDLAGGELAREARKAGFLPESGPAPDEPRGAPAPVAGLPSAPATVPWERAGEHVGETVTVEGKIVRARKAGRALFLNFHPNWRKHLTVVVTPTALGRSPEEPERRYRGRVVRVTGKVAIYKGRPEIVVRSPGAIVVLH